MTATDVRSRLLTAVTLAGGTVDFYMIVDLPVPDRYRWARGTNKRHTVTTPYLPRDFDGREEERGARLEAKSDEGGSYYQSESTVKMN
jgi:hypothetical protein